MARHDQQNPSTVLLQEYFANGDDRFLDVLRATAAPKFLATIVDKWKADPRPWARRQILAYLAEPLECPGHEPVVKRLFKHAEARHDDELMAAFLVAFDRLVRRVRKRRTHYDWQSRTFWEEESLVTPRNRVHPVNAKRSAINPLTLERMQVPFRPSRPGARLFSYRTRYYLRRRAWRYFRRMGFQRPDSYVGSIARALRDYRDEDLAVGENILDSWGLLQACFRHHDALEFLASTVRLRENRSLGELTPAPRFAHLWQRAEAFEVLIGLVAEAQARLVRVWAMQLIRREHQRALAGLEVKTLLGLLNHSDNEVQEFGAELLRTYPGLEKLPLETWLKLLETKNPAALSIICEQMARHVTPDRLNLERCLALCCAAPTPVARMGFDILKKRDLSSPNDRTMLVRLADAECAAVAGEMTEWALGLIGAVDRYDRDGVTAFFDSLLPEVRQSALTWLAPGAPGYDDPQLWARIIETPFDEVKLRLIELLDQRMRLPGTNADQLTSVWCSVILGVHRGGRQKPRAVRQLARAIADEPAKAEVLAPILAVAVRSVRGPEHRAGLAAVVSLVEQCPDAAPIIQKLLPELTIPHPEETAAT